ncbi:MAG: CocE/NonD family hydrolase [Parabacteroides sp.]
MKKYLVIFLFLSIFVQAQVREKTWAEMHYTRTNVMIPMRDGVRLYTSIYMPISNAGKHPILLFRTPYSVAPYDNTPNNLGPDSYTLNDYIIVNQDVRGRWMSEGEFVNVRPFNANKKSKHDIDEASDTYDTIDWLIKHVQNNNGCVGAKGNSYGGFYTLMAGLSGHPALKAIVPQAPVTDWYMGDDFHHNGALMLMDAFGFSRTISSPRPAPTTVGPYKPPFIEADSYSSYLRIGALKNFSYLMGDSIQFWSQVMEHPDYDSWWKARDTRRSCYNIKPAVMIVGGFFDAEDLYGTINLYKDIKRQSPLTNLSLVIGPWNHGGYNGVFFNYLGNVRFSKENMNAYYKKVEFNFLDTYLRGKGNAVKTPDAKIFFSGENTWASFESWPPKNVEGTSFYLNENGQLGLSSPEAVQSYSDYISDPAKPVPFVKDAILGRNKEYMTDDQRFASTRPDVLTFVTDPLSEDVKMGGDVIADLKVSISTTDADFVVKLIDVFPDNFVYDELKDGKGDGKDYFMKGYQMLVRGDLIRGRYRNSFEKPEAFVPGQPTTVSFSLCDIAHTFMKGHRIMVQIQSSWFPLVDRNPQQFVDIYHCDDKAFIKSTIKIYHQKGLASRIILPVLK